jgi:hypothetical protein
MGDLTLDDATTAARIVRVVLLLIAGTVLMLVAKFGWVGYREGSTARALGAAAYCVLALTPVVTLFQFDEPLEVVPAAVYGVALVLSVLALRRLYVVHPEWTRVRLAAERAEAATALAIVRDEQDVLRADDRVSQAGERADSRAMYDAGHLDETTATYDHRVEVRDEQDANREHSHQLQDDERATARADEDDRL